MVFGVGLPEEFAKGLAVWLFLSRLSRVEWSTRSYLLAGAVSGLAFGTAEAVTYAVAYQQGLSTDSTGYAGALVWRLLSGGLFHACMAGIVGFFIGLAHYHRRHAALLMLLGLALAAVLHGTYDRLSSGWGGVIVAAVTVFIFAGYVQTGDTIARDYNALEGH